MTLQERTSELTRPVPTATRTPEYDAIVVGARVGGAATAMLLARRGRRVLLVDRRRPGRQRVRHRDGAAAGRDGRALQRDPGPPNRRGRPGGDPDDGVGGGAGRDRSVDRGPVHGRADDRCFGDGRPARSDGSTDDCSLGDGCADDADPSATRS